MDPELVYSESQRSTTHQKYDGNYHLAWLSSTSAGIPPRRRLASALFVIIMMVMLMIMLLILIFVTIWTLTMQMTMI